MYKIQHGSRVSRGGSLSANPRRVALAVLRASAEGARPEDVLNRDGVMLSQKDLSLATHIIYTCVRHRSRLDFLIDGKLESAKNTPQTVRIILRMGLAQLLFLTRLAKHVVVSETAELAKKFSPGREGLVNAILRSFIIDMESDSYFPKEIDGRETPLVTRLATLYSYPDWMAERLIGSGGLREARAFMAASNQPVPPTIRVNSRLADRDEFAKTLPFETVPTKFSPWGLLPTGFGGKLRAWPGYDEGLFSIQDEASQITGLLAAGDAEPQNVLDVCAGLGGKTFVILNAFPKARALALDRREDRLKALSLEARRLRLQDSVRVMTGDLTELDFRPRFDLVIVDAPCSGLGVIRRRPDLKWKKCPGDILRDAELQGTFLDSAAKAVLPGGKLIYSVCTVTEEEGPGVAKKFLERNGDFRPDESLLPELAPLVSGPGQLTLLPHRHGTDGFHYSVFRRKD
ncbi:MAG: hypothetical protein LBF41_04870 [Deltaproteobacteria bacterium]|jgi:16S rRNA (cytosine967-C5)-methyltransferase|nr:hypothetical protein [Deltaproteobacteria bacterium]